MYTWVLFEQLLPFPFQGYDSHCPSSSSRNSVVRIRLPWEVSNTVECYLSLFLLSNRICFIARFIRVVFYKDIKKRETLLCAVIFPEVFLPLYVEMGTLRTTFASPVKGYDSHRSSSSSRNVSIRIRIL